MRIFLSVPTKRKGRCTLAISISLGSSLSVKPQGTTAPTLGLDSELLGSGTVESLEMHTSKVCPSEKARILTEFLLRPVIAGSWKEDKIRHIFDAVTRIFSGKEMQGEVSTSQTTPAFTELDFLIAFFLKYWEKASNGLVKVVLDRISGLWTRAATPISVRAFYFLSLLLRSCGEHREADGRDKLEFADFAALFDSGFLRRMTSVDRTDVEAVVRARLVELFHRASLTYEPRNLQDSEKRSSSLQDWHGRLSPNAPMRNVMERFLMAEFAGSAGAAREVFHAHYALELPTLDLSSMSAGSLELARRTLLFVSLIDKECAHFVEIAQSGANRENLTRLFGETIDKMTVSYEIVLTKVVVRITFPVGTPIHDDLRTAFGDIGRSMANLVKQGVCDFVKKSEVCLDLTFGWQIMVGNVEYARDALKETSPQKQR